jgi:AcrR family transcriptional regulator
VDEVELTDAKQRVLDMAERQFLEHGYAAVTLRDIANALGMRQASLYYHFPEGKEQLYVEMAERMFERHRIGMEAAMASAGVELAQQLAAILHWFGSQPSINFLGIWYADMPALSDERARQLAWAAYRSIFEPLRQAFIAANQRGEARPVHPDLLAGFFLSMMDGITFSETQQSIMTRAAMETELVKLLLDGLRPRVQPNG